mgnify:CR=1 FL=1
MSKYAALFCVFTYVFCACCGAQTPEAAGPISMEGSGLAWYDARGLTVEGKGWEDTETFYDRLPARAKGEVPGAVWSLSLHSAGYCVHFRTNATTIATRYTLRNDRVAMPHMPATGVSGVDLYALHEGEWKWLAISRPERAGTSTFTLVDDIAGGTREYRLYLPLYNGIESLYIGVPEGALFEPGAGFPEDQKPVVFYGTSITHGACASRPGMAHTAIAGRRLGRPVINLGFSGNGRMQPPVADFLGELDPAVFFIDCLPNMSAETVVDNAETFLRKLRAARPDTPIILSEDRTYGYAFLRPSVKASQAARRQQLRKVFEQLQAGGMKGLHYLPHTAQAGVEEALVDGSHPSDLGMMRQAAAFEPILREVLGQ